MRDVQDLMSWLHGFRERPASLPELKARLTETRISIDDVRGSVRFSAERYARNLFAMGPQFHALVLCWSPGQRSPIHDHRGAACGVVVLEGEAVETTYQLGADGRLETGTRSELRAGEIAGSQDDDIHEIANLGSEGLVTLHIYCPYLSEFRIYDRVTHEVSMFRDPLVEATRIDASARVERVEASPAEPGVTG